MPLSAGCWRRPLGLSCCALSSPKIRHPLVVFVAPTKRCVGDTIGIQVETSVLSPTQMRVASRRCRSFPS